jgi:hypothetical protein
MLRFLVFVVVTLAAPWAGNFARAADDVAPAPVIAPVVATPATPPTPEGPACPVPPPPPDCGPVGAFVAGLNSCLQFASATGWQINLQNGSVNRLAILVGVALIHRDTAKLGIGIYCGAGLSTEEKNAGQCDLLFSAAKFGAAGVGVQMLNLEGKSIFQGLATLAVHLPGTE